MKQRPVAIGLLVCEQVIVEEKTGNVTPVNCFSHKRVKQVPSECFPFVVLAFLTDGSGAINLDVEISRLDSLEVFFRRSYVYEFTSPLNQVRCMIRVNDCSFPTIGHYQVSLIADQETIAQRKIVVTKEKP